MSLNKRTQLSVSSILASAVLVTMVSATSPVPLSQSPQKVAPETPFHNKLEVAKKNDAQENTSGGTMLSPAPNRTGEPSANRPSGMDPTLTQPSGLPEGTQPGDSVNTVPPETDSQPPTR